MHLRSGFWMRPVTYESCGLVGTIRLLRHEFHEFCTKGKPVATNQPKLSRSGDSLAVDPIARARHFHIAAPEPGALRRASFRLRLGPPDMNRDVTSFKQKTNQRIPNWDAVEVVPTRNRAEAE